MVGDIFTVEVTENDIQSGVPCSSGNCPIAMAIERTIGQLFPVSGCFTMFSIDAKRKIRVMECDQDNFINFIGDFDQGKKVKPFSFRFQEVDPKF